LLAPVTGCSSDAEQPSAELPPASSSAAETTPELPPLGPKDFPVPDEARTQDQTGAERFLKYYVDLINRQQAVPDGGPLRDLSSGCNDCQRIARLYDEAAAADEKIRGGELRIATDPGVTVTGDTARISFIARVEAVATIDASGEVVADSQYAAEPRLPSGMNLLWSREKGSWLVAALTIG
jgi:hypothetical protein